MEVLFGLTIVAFIAWSIYKAGKRTGSRLGFNAGRARARRRRRR